MKKRLFIILAPEFEEIEAITPIDILRRAEIDVVIASLEDEKLVLGRNGLRIEADIALNELSDTNFDAIVIPGGPGAQRLRKDPRVIKLIKKLYANKCLIAAICAGPTVLLDAGILGGKPYTAHFSTKDELPDIQADQAVVIYQNILTSQGAGTALAFAFAIVEFLHGKDLVNKIKKNICYFEQS